jgi:hypothetical protein
VDVSDRVLVNELASLTADRFAASHGADHRIDLPIERLGSGEYLLAIEATQGEYTARRGVRFTIGDRDR